MREIAKRRDSVRYINDASLYRLDMESSKELAVESWPRLALLESHASREMDRVDYR
jgi:hypothetical protein